MSADPTTIPSGSFHERSGNRTRALDNLRTRRTADWLPAQHSIVRRLDIERLWVVVDVLQGALDLIQDTRDGSGSQ